MGILVDDAAGYVRIEIDGDFNVDRADYFRTEIKRLIENGKRRFVIDFSKCDFIDSTGLGVLLSSYKRLNEVNGELKICSITNPNVLKVFSLTRLDRVFDIYPTYNDAVNQ